MSLPPVANLFAVMERDPTALAELETSLREAEFDAVWRPAEHWVVATAQLPDGAADGQPLRDRGFAFAQGRDRLEQLGERWLEDVAALADERPGHLDELPGDFGFLRVRSDGSATAVRSCGGCAAPIYIYRRPGGIAIGTLLDYFTRFLPERFSIDPLVAATFVKLFFIDGRTFLNGVRMLERGHFAHIRPDGSHATGRYWDPRPASDEEIIATPDHQRELRRVLISAIERDLDPAGNNMVSLSGGVDSSSVASLVRRVVGYGLSSFSNLPPQEPHRTRELAYLDPLVAELGIEPARKVFITPDEQLRLLHTTTSLPYQIEHPVLLDLPPLASSGEVRVLVSGDFADVSGAHLQRITDWIRATPLTRILGPRANLPFGPRDRLRWAKRRALDLLGRPALPVQPGTMEWVHPDVGDEFDSFYRRLQRRTGTSIVSELAVHDAADGWVSMNWEGATRFGVRRSIPFYTREALELAYRCHPSELLDGRPKSLMRAALNGDVPHRNLYRPDKSDGVWGPAFKRPPLEVPELPPSVESVVRPDWFPRPPAEIDWYDASDLIRLAQLGSYLL